MGWTRRANPRWARNEDRGQYPSEYKTDVRFDSQGNFKVSNWETCWTRSRRDWKRYTNRVIRHANKLQIAHELEMYEEELQALWEDQWYDDDYDYSYFDDWGDNCYEYPEPEPEPEYEPFDDPYWFRYYNGDY